MGEQVQELRALVAIMLRPMARLLQIAGISCKDQNEEFRIASVLVAQLSLPKGVGAKNVSLISARTGLTRRDVRKILGILAGVGGKRKSSARRGGHRGQRVIDAWCYYSRFRDEYGNPKILKISGRRGSFAELCRLYGGEQHPMILKDLLNVKAVRALPDDRLELLRRDYAEINLSKAGLAALFEQLAEHFETVVHNLTHPEARDQLLCRRVVNFRVDAEKAKLLMNDATDGVNSRFDHFRDQFGDPYYSAPQDSTETKHVSLTAYLTVKEGSSLELGELPPPDGAK